MPELSNIELLKIPARDGYQLAATIFHPEKSNNIVIQLHTGTGIPQKLYANFASFLASCGMTVITFDYRGVAASSPESLDGFEANVVDWGRLDMSGVFDWVLERYPEHKKVVIGHSMGGQMIGLMDHHAEIDQIFLIAASTGYWRDMNSPYKWLPAFFWYFLIPLHTRVYGYANAMKIRQGENLPKGVALQWRKWCIQPEYFEPDLSGELAPSYFDQVTTPIKAIRITDDPLANATTFHKLLKFYSAAEIEVEELDPPSFDLKEIGHTGFFSRKMLKAWESLVAEIVS